VKADLSTTAILRAEGAALFASALTLLFCVEPSWATAAAFFFAPDLSLFAFLHGPRAGVILYNLTHSTLGGLGLAMLGVSLEMPLLIELAAVWLAHVGFDRMLGYGLKRSLSFHKTHLGPIGLWRRSTRSRSQG